MKISNVENGEAAGLGGGVPEEDWELIRCGSAQAPDLSQAPLYRKLPVKMGYARASEIYPPGSKIRVRTMEGDQVKEVSGDLYLMIGVDFEVYTNTRQYFERHNRWSEALYPIPPERLRTVEDAVRGVDVETRPLAGHIRQCTPVGKCIRARELTRRTMVITGSGDCLWGKPGDFLAAGAEDLTNFRVIDKEIFHRTYGPADPEETAQPAASGNRPK